MRIEGEKETHEGTIHKGGGMKVTATWDEVKISASEDIERVTVTDEADSLAFEMPTEAEASSLVIKAVEL